MTSLQPELLLFLARSLRNILTTIFTVFVLSVLVIGWLFLQRYVSIYRIEDHLLKIKIFGITLHRIWWTEIEDVKIVPIFGLLGAYRISGYEFSRKRVLISRRKGLVREVLLSPKNPEKFVQEISDRMKRAQATSEGRR